MLKDSKIDENYISKLRNISETTSSDVIHIILSDLKWPVIQKKCGKLPISNPTLFYHLGKQLNNIAFDQGFNFSDVFFDKTQLKKGNFILSPYIEQRLRLSIMCRLNAIGILDIKTKALPIYERISYPSLHKLSQTLHIINDVDLIDSYVLIENINDSDLTSERSIVRMPLSEFIDCAIDLNSANPSQLHLLDRLTELELSIEQKKALTELILQRILQQALNIKANHSKFFNKIQTEFICDLLSQPYLQQSLGLLSGSVLLNFLLNFPIEVVIKLFLSSDEIVRDKVLSPTSIQTNLVELTPIHRHKYMHFLLLYPHYLKNNQVLTLPAKHPLSKIDAQMQVFLENADQLVGYLNKIKIKDRINWINKIGYQYIYELVKHDLELLVQISRLVLPDIQVFLQKIVVYIPEADLLTHQKTRDKNDFPFLFQQMLMLKKEQDLSETHMPPCKKAKLI